MMDRIAVRIEEWIAMVLLEAVEWIAVVGEIRRRIEMLVASVDILDRDLDSVLSTARRRTYPHEFN